MHTWGNYNHNDRNLHTTAPPSLTPEEKGSGRIRSDEDQSLMQPEPQISSRNQLAPGLVSYTVLTQGKLKHLVPEFNMNPSISCLKLLEVIINVVFNLHLPAT